MAFWILCGGEKDMCNKLYVSAHALTTCLKLHGDCQLHLVLLATLGVHQNRFEYILCVGNTLGWIVTVSLSLIHI